MTRLRIEGVGHMGHIGARILYHAIRVYARAYAYQLFNLPLSAPPKQRALSAAKRCGGTDSVSGAHTHRYPCSTTINRVYFDSCPERVRKSAESLPKRWSESSVSPSDGRSREAKALRRFRAQLVEHVGGKPNVAQEALIQSISQLRLLAPLKRFLHGFPCKRVLQGARADPRQLISRGLCWLRR
jgi:hypothetical protein